MISYYGINDLFLQQVVERKKSIAIRSQEKEISYGELEVMINKMSSYMYNVGVRREKIVCILASRSIELIACVFSIIRSGGAYFIIDRKLPEYRIREVIIKVSPHMLVIDKNVDLNLRDLCKVVEIDELIKEEAAEIMVICDRKPEDLLYMVLTSGTTGEPKIVMIEEKNILAYLKSFIKTLQLADNDVNLQQSPCYYDGFAEEVYSMLLIGGTLILVDDNVLKSPRLIKKTIEAYAITILATTPIMLKQLNQMGSIKHLKKIICSGDVLLRNDYSELIKNIEIYNMYGPTETTVCATIYKCPMTEESNPCIGKPLAHCDIVICDENRISLTNGRVGEIYIRGNSVARGYLGDKQLDKESFVNIGGKRAYRTGDLGILKENGEIEFKGRNDRQIKIRGNRVELDEVNSIISKCPDVLNSAITVYIDADNKKMCYFFVAEGEKTKTIRQYAQEYLPDYMIPHKFIQVKEICMLETGKIDYKRLSRLIDEKKNKSKIKVSIMCDENINKFINVVCGFLQTDQEVDESFLSYNFVDLGIDSLTYVNLIIELEDTYNFEFEDDFLAMSNFDNMRALYEYIENKGILIGN